jgi:hypothetical protein
MIEIKEWKNMHIVAVIDIMLSSDFSDIFNNVLSDAISKDIDLARIFTYCFDNKVKFHKYVAVSKGDEEYLKNFARTTLKIQLPGKNLNNFTNYSTTIEIVRDGKTYSVLLYFLLE